jgi:hypothetical protein
VERTQAFLPWEFFFAMELTVAFSNKKGSIRILPKLFTSSGVAVIA